MRKFLNTGGKGILVEGFDDNTGIDVKFIESTTKPDGSAFSDTDAGPLYLKDGSTGDWYIRSLDGNKVDARIWGIIGDGVTDNTTAIQKLAADISGFKGITVKFPKGVYLVSRTTGFVATFEDMDGLTIDAVEAVFLVNDFTDFSTLSLTFSGSTATATTPSPHGLTGSPLLVIKNTTDAGYNYAGNVTVTGANTFTYPLYRTPSGAATAQWRKADITKGLFQFNTCHNLTLYLNFQGTAQPLYGIYRLGWTVVKLNEGCTKVRGNIYATGAAYVIWSGDFNLDTGNMKDANLNITYNGVGYPIALWKSGDNSTFTISGDQSHRGAYVGGCNHSRFIMRVKNYDVSGILLTHQSVGSNMYGCTDLDIDISDTGSDQQVTLYAVGNYRTILLFADYAQSATAAIENIRAVVNGKDSKYTTAFRTISTDPLHAIKDVRITGVFDRSGILASECGPDFTIGDEPNPANVGPYSGVKINKFKVINPATGTVPSAVIKIYNLQDDILLDTYESTSPKIISLPAGRAKRVTPYVKDDLFTQTEVALLQHTSGGVNLLNTKIIHTFSFALGSGDFTITWTGDIPASGNTGLFCVGTSPSIAAAQGLGCRIVSGNLEVLLYGATTSDYYMLRVAGFQARQSVLSTQNIAICRNSTELAIYVNGVKEVVTIVTAGTSPGYNATLTGTYFVIGNEQSTYKYIGNVYQTAIINVDKSYLFPRFAFQSGQVESDKAVNTFLIDDTTLNGGFETAGSPNVFANWSQTLPGSSTLTADTDAYAGTKSAAFNVNSTNDYVSVSQNILTIGKEYRFSVAMKLKSGAGGTVQIVGIGNNPSYTPDGTWRIYSFVGVATATTLEIKRGAMPNSTVLIDSVKVSYPGYLVNLDFTKSPVDLSTGLKPTYDTSRPGMPIADVLTMSNNRGDINFTLYPGSDAYKQIITSPLTANRTITLSTSYARQGDTFHVIRAASSTGVFTLNVGGLATLLAGQWCIISYGASGWALVAFGSLSSVLPINQGGTGLSTLGFAGQQLRVNAGATALEYFTPTAAAQNVVPLKDFYATVGNASSTPNVYTALYSYDIPANTLTANGQKIKAKFTGQFIDSDNDTGLTIFINGTGVSTQSRLGITGWEVEFIMIRNGINTYRISATYRGGGDWAPFVDINDFGSVDYTSIITLALWGTSSVGMIGAITASTGVITWEAAAP